MCIRAQGQPAIASPGQPRPAPGSPSLACTNQQEVKGLLEDEFTCDYDQKPPIVSPRARVEGGDDTLPTGSKPRLGRSPMELHSGSVSRGGLNTTCAKITTNWKYSSDIRSLALPGTFNSAFAEEA